MANIYFIKIIFLLFSAGLGKGFIDGTKLSFSIYIVFIKILLIFIRILGVWWVLKYFWNSLNIHLIAYHGWYAIEI